jgi:hypothetical protein
MKELTLALELLSPGDSVESKELMVLGILSVLSKQTEDHIQLKQMVRERDERLILGQFAEEFESKILTQIGGKWAKTYIHPDTRRGIHKESLKRLHNAFCDGVLVGMERGKYEDILKKVCPSTLDLEAASTIVLDDFKKMKNDRVDDDAHPTITKDMTYPLVTCSTVRSNMFQVVYPS